MSIINKMLQDLDRRQGASDSDATLVQQVRSVSPPRKDREWFWRIIAVLMIAALGWVAWIAWQLQPREPVATEQAFKAAQNAPLKPPPAPAPSAPKPAAQEPADLKPAAEQPAPQVVETMKLAPGIETPIREQPRKPALKAPAQAVSPPAAAAAPVAAAKAGVSAAATTRLDLDIPPARILQAPAQAAARVEKRDRVRTAEDRAETEFRRGAVLLNQGRVAEAVDVFAAALSISPAHEAARQALVALHLEQGRIDEARRLLQEGVALNPGNVRFAFVLARIHIERRDFAAALDVLNSVKAPAQGGAEFQSMRGTVLQQLGRHAEAADAFESALRAAPQNGALWMGLGISLETLARKAEAADAFRRAAASATLGAEARDYAERRARQLQ
ncbi:MAG: tetratricopeptide repeat protein [Pseudomonadota bacterium]